MFRIFWVHNCFLTAIVKTINSSPATNIATLSQTIAFSSLTAAFPRLRVCNVYIHSLTATNEHWIREYQLKHVPDYQWKLPDSKWDCFTLLSESFPIDLLAVNCIQKKRLVVVVCSKKRYSECKEFSPRWRCRQGSLLFADSCCWTYWPKHLGIVCLSEK